MGEMESLPTPPAFKRLAAILAIFSADGSLAAAFGLNSGAAEPTKILFSSASARTSAIVQVNGLQIALSFL
jgi:hypothetical protein